MSAFGFSYFADRFFLLSRHHIYRRHNLCRRCLMYHMSRARDAAEGAVSYITMQLCGLLRFDKSIFTACNDGHGHLEMSVGLSEAVGFRDHESRFDCGSPDLRWTHSQLFRKACKFLWDRPRAEDLAKKKRPHEFAKNRRYRVA